MLGWSTFESANWHADVATGIPGIGTEYPLHDRTRVGIPEYCPKRGTIGVVSDEVAGLTRESADVNLLLHKFPCGCQSCLEIFLDPCVCSLPCVN